MTISLNGQTRAIRTGATMADLLEELDLQPVRVAVEINRELITRRAYAATALQDGDAVEIVTLVGGG